MGVIKSGNKQKKFSKFRIVFKREKAYNKRIEKSYFEIHIFAILKFPLR
jgi:hypothetical protein